MNDEHHGIKIAPFVVRVAIELHRGLVNRVVSDQPGVRYVVLDDDVEALELDEIRELKIEPKSFDAGEVDPELKCIKEFNTKMEELVKKLEEAES